MEFGITSLWAHMGWLAKGVVYVLLIMSVASLGITIERLLTLVRGRKASLRLLEAFEKHVGARAWQQAVKLGGTEPRSPLSRVLPSGVQAFLDAQTDKHLGRSEVLEAAEAAIARGVDRESFGLRRGLGTLATVGSTAPFIGLFGTVVGIVNAFQQIAARGSGGLGTVSAGIAEALVTTALGILVAIPAVMLFNYFTNRVDEADAAMRDAGSALLEACRKSVGGSVGTNARETAVATPAA